MAISVSSPLEVRRHQGPQAPWTYALLDARQREIAGRVQGGGPGALLLSELAPVITFGRRATRSELLLSPELLERAGVSLHETDRGGLATYHGPGQWVLFVVDTLERLTGDPRGVRKALEALLETALEVGRLLDPTAEIRSGAETGVWTRQGKFAAVGVQVERGVLLHGLSLNGLRTPTSFLGLKPCGLEAPVDFLLKPGASDAEFMELGITLAGVAARNFYQRAASPELTASQVRGYTDRTLTIGS